MNENDVEDMVGSIENFDIGRMAMHLNIPPQKFIDEVIKTMGAIGTMHMEDNEPFIATISADSGEIIRITVERTE